MINRLDYLVVTHRSSSVYSGIRQLQLILLKVALLLGVEVHTGVEFLGLNEPSGENGTVISTTRYEHQFFLIFMGQ